MIRILILWRDGDLEDAIALMAERTALTERMSTAYERGETISIDIAQDPHNLEMFTRYAEQYGGDTGINASLQQGAAFEMAVPGVGHADFRVLANREFLACASEPVLISPGLHAGGTHLDEQTATIGELEKLALGLGLCVVDSGRGKGVVAASHDASAGRFDIPPKWRDFVVCHETS